jgi:hypothetical protein
MSLCRFGGCTKAQDQIEELREALEEALDGWDAHDDFDWRRERREQLRVLLNKGKPHG